VVGVAGTVQSSHQPADVEALQIYLPIGPQADPFGAVLLVRVRGDASEHLGAIKGQVWALDPKLPLSEVATMEARISQTLSRPRFNLALLAIFAGMGLVL